MDFLSTNEKGKPTSDQPHNPNHHPKPSKPELLNSAKLVAEAAKSHFRHEQDKVDKPKVAGAAADLLNAASEFGKLDDKKGLGKYVDTAENYLYNGGATDTSASHTHSSSHSEGGHGNSGSGYVEYVKMAGDFMKKH
ncbi:nodulin-related protein 1 [Forsythia ovata]|uniref:Nodulin-related protein 1 n=1 Tax=Forsythia ovata TaxID=205694 RepID=A0ABD1XEV3_9LAMI